MRDLRIIKNGEIDLVANKDDLLVVTRLMVEPRCIERPNHLFNLTLRRAVKNRELNSLIRNFHNLNKTCERFVFN
jgi:hypothetical protein